MLVGTIIEVSGAMGWIRCDNPGEADIRFHKAAVMDRVVLQVGTRVMFERAQTAVGPRAATVRIL